MEQPNNEITIAWADMEEKHKAMAIAAHAVKLGTTPSKRETVYKVFEMGKPLIIFAPDYSYCRIHEASVGVMNVLIKNYL